MKIRVNFLEPFRMLDWIDHPDRNSKNKIFMRGQTFARWHKGGDGEGKPYITGTLIRSAVIRAAENLLLLSNGVVGGKKCCPGEFLTKGRGAKVHLRQRANLRWTAEKTCREQRRAPCPLCELLGQFDDAASGERDKSRFHIHFGNLDLQGKPSFSSPEEIAFGKTERALNRVDYATSKAHDFFKVWEIDHLLVPPFECDLTIRKDVSLEAISLLKDSLRFIDRLCGALCTIDIDDENSDAARPTSPLKSGRRAEVDVTAGFIADVFREGGELDRLRIVADAIRLMRRDKKMVLGLPLDHEGKENHYVWDKKKDDRSVRNLLTEMARSIPDKEWRAFCEQVGEGLYQKAKDLRGALSVTQRILGDAAFWGAPDKDIDPSTSFFSPFRETVVTGSLRAETPFFFGTETGGAEQTSFVVLVDHQGRYRLPRSVLRGVLRRDLRSVFGTGCNAELGGRPCLCPVCQIMRNVTLMDSRSAYYVSPEIRQRIRLNPFTGTAAEGALFDMEVGPEGLEFPFRLYYRGLGDVPDELKNVLKWWADGQAFMGGATGTGKGTFKLINLKSTSFDLLDPGSRQEYLLHRGWRDEIAQLKLTDMPLNVKRPRGPLWEKVSVNIEIGSPFLNGDPVQALVEGGGDIISFSKYTSRDILRVYAYKSESFRGVVRAAVGRRGEDEDRVSGKKGPLLTLTHQDCECHLCRIFGSEFEAGKVRFEDLVIDFRNIEKFPKLFDHVAIDRFSGGAVDRKKFNDCSLPGSPKHPLIMEGNLWIRTDLRKDEIEALGKALVDIRAGFYPFGGKGGVGYGWVSNLEIKGEGEMVQQLQRIMEEDFPGTPVPAAPPDKPDSALNIPPIEGAVYYPHYFLKPAAEVNRKRQPTGHQTFDKDLLTGKIKCRMTNLTPLIIPDTQDDDFFKLADKKKEKYHKSFCFFRLNGEIMIPGPEIRGMISSVYEALTNSCFRVFNEKDRLSWRMEADKNVLEQYRPGRVKKVIEDGKEVFKIIEMQEIRYPFYDKDCPIRKSQGEFFKWEGKDQPYYPHPTGSDQRLLGLAGYNRTHANENIAADYRIIKHRKKPGPDEAFMFVATPSENSTAYTNSVFKDRVTGYLKVTGPNKVEKEKGCDPDLRSVPTNRDEVILNKIRPSEHRVDCKKKDEECKKIGRQGVRCSRDHNQTCYRMRLEPGFACCEKDEKDPENSLTYTMTKRCERVFIEAKGREMPVNRKAIQNFKFLAKEYERNANQQETPVVFRTVVPKTINDGDLVYFREENGEVVEIIPVRISRNVDTMYLGKRFIGNNDDLRPCHREWLEEEDLSLLDPYPEKKLFRRHPEGLCPSCRLFGTDSYKGRLRFGFAALEGEPRWLRGGDNAPFGGMLTLPLLESPRPTWSMPNSHSVVPGRKFYIHHHGWKDVDAGKHPTTKEPIKKTVNNCTVEPLGIGNSFIFEICFENLHRYELGLLIYALQLEKGLAHKLGMGKALGFGSVDITVENIALRTIAAEWENGSHEIDKWISDGKKEIGRWFEEDWGKIRHIEHLRELLYFPKENQDFTVFYPPLRQRDIEESNLPGYEELKDEFKKEGGKAREDLLTIPGTPWYLPINRKKDS